jgi:hypothetical protein
VWFACVMPSTLNEWGSSAVDVVALLSRGRWFSGARADALSGPGARRNDAWWLADDAGALIFGPGALRGDAVALR